MTFSANNYQLDECLDWIIENKFTRIVIQLKPDELSNSVDIITYLKDENKKRFANNASSQIQTLDFYVTQTNTCCVDLLVTQHLNQLDAIIHIGKVCLSLPEIRNEKDISNPPSVLLAFGHPNIPNVKLKNDIELILQEIETLKETDRNARICLLYDTNLIDYANKIEELVFQRGSTNFVEVAKLYCPSQTWYTTPNNQSKLIKDQIDGDNMFGHYVLSRPISAYNCAIYLGDRLSIQLTLQGPSKLLKINCQHDDDNDDDSLHVDKVNVSKLLNKRIALVGRLKEEEDLKIGVIITNPLPDVRRIMERLETYSKPRKHTLYFISMVQTIDECKIGNFDLCDAFIVINSCNCSTILESLVFNRPIITELEFKLACGFEAEYGRVSWPGSSSHLSEDDIINKRKVSDVSLALIHTRNELLERCSQARANKWSGLDYNKASGGGVGGGEGESLLVEEGLKGIASAYSSEPLKKTVTTSVGGEKCAGTSSTNITNTVADDSGVAGGGYGCCDGNE